MEGNIELHHLKQQELPWLAYVSCWGMRAACAGGENDAPPFVDFVIMTVADALNGPFFPES